MTDSSSARVSRRPNLAIGVNEDIKYIRRTHMQCGVCRAYVPIVGAVSWFTSVSVHGMGTVPTMLQSISINSGTTTELI